VKLLRVWCGPMCAAKTTGALDAARRYARHGKKVLLVRPAISRRDHEHDPSSLSTKNGEDFPCHEFEHAFDMATFVEDADVDVVWIDEPNHFPDESVLYAYICRIREKAIVLVSGLGATSELDPFGHSIPRLLAVADHVHWLSADCDACNTHGTATRSLYIGEGLKDSQLQVGGAESYRPVCPDCWTKLMKLDPASRWQMV
jgi:thymidine kinase